MENLFEDLMVLVKNSYDFGFTYIDIPLDDKVYRVFDYGVTSWSSFAAPNAVNCRGTMFDVTDIESPKLVSLPPAKFFNYHEGTQDHTLGKHLGVVMVKRDGSLISTYLHNDELRLKSKGYILSDQARWAQNLLDNNYKQLKTSLYSLAKQGYTVNMEYTAPNNMIVVFYPQESLTVLSIRENATGKMYYDDNLMEKFKDYPDVLEHLVENKKMSNIAGKEIEVYINGVLEETEGEGYVIEIVDDNKQESYLVKIKNKKYVLVHNAKASIESPKKVIECILNNKTDDLRALFYNDKEILKYIDNLELIAVKRYNEFKNKVEHYVQDNKNLSIKDFAIKSQKDFGSKSGLVINLYKGKENNYIDHIIRNKEEFFPEIKFHGEKNYKKVIKN